MVDFTNIVDIVMKIIEFADTFVSTISTIMFTSVSDVINLIRTGGTLYISTISDYTYSISFPNLSVLADILNIIFDLMISPSYLFGFTSDNLPFIMVILSLFIWYPIVGGLVKLVTNLFT